MKIETWTTFKDAKNRYWVIIDLDHWHPETGKFIPEIQRVIMYQVGTTGKIERIPYSIFLKMLETNKMELYTI